MAPCSDGDLGSRDSVRGLFSTKLTLPYTSPERHVDLIEARISKVYHVPPEQNHEFCRPAVGVMSETSRYTSSRLQLFPTAMLTSAGC